MQYHFTQVLSGLLFGEGETPQKKSNVKSPINPSLARLSFTITSSWPSTWPHKFDNSLEQKLTLCLKCCCTRPWLWPPCWMRRRRWLGVVWCCCSVPCSGKPPHTLEPLSAQQLLSLCWWKAPEPASPLPQLALHIKSCLLEKLSRSIVPAFATGLPDNS